MELIRLATNLANLESVPIVLDQQSSSLVLKFTDADTVMAAASLRGSLGGPVGVWLEVDPDDYPAALAARDVATLSWLIGLDHVVIEARANALAHAEVVSALLTNDEVNFVNGVASLRGAYNRPAPPSPLTVWSYDGEVLRSADRVLDEHASSWSVAGTLSIFS
jgi:hypothetical protein